MITLPAKPLADALALVRQAIEGRNTIPILGHVLITPEKGVVTLTGTNLDIMLRAEVAAECDAAPGFTADAGDLASVLARIIAGSSTATATLTLEEGHVAVKGGRVRARLPVLPAEDFPELSFAPAHDADAKITTSEIDAPAFVRALGQCQHAVSDEDTSYYLCGVHLSAEVDGGGTAVVATNRYVLARRSLAAAMALPDVGIIIPAKTVSIAVKLLEKAKTAVLRLAPGKIAIEGTGWLLASKLIDGTFPNWRRVIPAAGKNRAAIDCPAWISAAETCAALADKKLGMRLNVTFADAAATLALRRAGGPEIEQAAPCTPDGEPAAFGVNGRYLAATLQAMGCDNATLTYDNGAPLLFTPEPPGDGRTLAVIMPMRIDP